MGIVLLLFVSAPALLHGQSTANTPGKAKLVAVERAAGWRSATEDELRLVIPPRAPVVGERIETEFRTASGVTDGKGHFIAGVVLITAGYSAEGKYSHYFVAQTPIRIGDFSLAQGQYILGWTRGQDKLLVTFYEAFTGKPVGQVDATRNPSISGVQSFHIWPPADRPFIQLGRFTFAYTIEGK
jgi:hypothetical protein